MPDPESLDPSHSDPAPDATQRLSAGAPADPYSTQRLNISKHLDAAGALKLPLTAPGESPDQTQKLTLPLVDVPPIRVQKQDQPAETAGQTLDLPPQPLAPRTLGWKVPLSLGVLVVLGVAAYLVFSRGPAPQIPPTSVVVLSESGPAGTQIYLEQAKAGDAHAMRMLGVMYFYGLNVPQDREKGLYWYRKAAEKGSDAAKSELSKIEGGR